jgi:site-specific recombinase XerD/predicted nucleic acid-binding Zn ribbon protein
MEATSGLNNHYFIKIAKRMTANNADLLAQFIILNRKESIISNNTIEIYIDGIVYLENYNNHKDLDKMDKKDIISFLDSYRKSETADPLHKWINTYNIRLDIIYKFFKWLYNLKNGGSIDESSPPIMNGIKRHKRKQKSPYQAKDLWTHEDDVTFLKYCEDSRLKCYHTMARDTSGRPHEILKIRVGDIMWQMNGTAQYAEVTIGKSCKTVPRTVPLINSIPFIKDWIREHPTGNIRNSFLFISYERQSVYRNIPLNPMSVANMYRQLKLEFFPRLLSNPDISEEEKNKIRILLEKPWNPYITRHTALTEKWKLLKSEQALRMHAGWSKTSKMVDIYTHEFGNESSELLLQAYGVVPANTHENNILKPRQCPNCNEPNKPDNRYCAKCKMVLVYDAYNEILEKEQKREQKRESELNDLKKKLDSVQEEQNRKFDQIFVWIRQNPRLANIKPEVLVQKLTGPNY